MNTLIFYGGNGLQNRRFKTSFDGTRSATSIDVQSIPLARDSGSRVVNTRYESKEILLSGKIDAYNTNIQDQVTEFSKSLSLDTESYLRVVPEYTHFTDTTSATAWTGTNITSISVNEYDFQTDSTSIEFTIGTATSPSIVYNSSTQWDIDDSTIDNIEIILYLYDASQINGIELKVGNDSSNYYSYLTTADYQGQALHNGSNLISFDKNSGTETGTVNDAEIDYFELIFDCELTSSMSGCYIDTIMGVNEERLRNFPVWRRGEIDISGLHHENDFVTWSSVFFNAKGYAIGTHTEQLFETVGITNTTYTKDIFLEGSYKSLPLFEVTLETATNITALQIKNLNNNESINMIPTTVTSGDIIRFGGIDKVITKNGEAIDFEGRIPSFDLGNNNIRLLVGNDIVTDVTPATPIASNQQRLNSVWGLTPANATMRGYISQSFITPNANDITEISINLQSLEIGVMYNTQFDIYSDNSGVPDTSIYTGYLGWSEISAGENVIDGLDIAVSSGTKYHLVLESSYETTFYTSGATQSRLRWENNSSDVYAGNAAYYRTTTYTAGALTASSWTLYTGDQKFSITQTSDPNWNIDISASYRKLYQN